MNILEDHPCTSVVTMGDKRVSDYAKALEMIRHDLAKLLGLRLILAESED